MDNEKCVNRIIYLVSFFISLFVLGNLYAFAENAIILINTNKGLGSINKKVFGNNFIAYDPTTYEDQHEPYYGYTDYGAGVWDPVKKESVKRAIDLAKGAGVSIIRFPGGCGTHHYNWKAAVGNKRKHFLYGIDEFLKTCEDIGAEAVITISYFTGNENDAANLVEYLNSPDDGKHIWALKRSRNGHPLPYGVKYFEIGNESWHGDHRKIKWVLPQEYANRYLKYYNAMKAVDSSANIGAILNTPDWNIKVLDIIKDKIDFGIIHIYPSPEASDDEIEGMDVKDIFAITLGPSILKEEQNLQETLRLLKQRTGRDIPLAITEYNGGFVQGRPVPYRHCLMTALVNAELLKIFMKPQNCILMANYWQFSNSYWGMIANGFDTDYRNFNKPYYKRPNYYVFELYKRYFDDQLISAEVDAEYYELNGVSVPYLSINASKSSDGSRVYLMVINKNMRNSITVTIRLKGFMPLNKVIVAVLNGSSIDAINELNHDNVKVREFGFNLGKNKFQFTFEPHSLTAIELIRNRE